MKIPWALMITFFLTYLSLWYFFCFFTNINLCTASFTHLFSCPFVIGINITYILSFMLPYYSYISHYNRGCIKLDRDICVCKIRQGYWYRNIFLLDFLYYICAWSTHIFKNKYPGFSGTATKKRRHVFWKNDPFFIS